MGKTYEALERAEEEYQENYFGTPTKSKKRSAVRAPRQASSRVAKERYEKLKANLLTRNGNESIKSILFTSTSHGDGSSTTAVNFAISLAKDSQLKVLLVDINLRTPSLHEVFKIGHTCGLSDCLTTGGQMDSGIKKVGPGSLYVLTCGKNHSAPVGLFESSGFDKFLKRIYERFDYVILDAPPVPAFSESRIICAKVDGVILVLHSGKTRRQVALRAKKELEEAGGKLIGQVLNKRKYYIPNWLYRRL